jgi:hypothetical protein
MPFRTDRRLYLNADRSKVVEENDPEAAYLYLGKGHQVSDADAEKYGLKPPKRTEVTEVKPEAKQIESPPENKAQASPKSSEKT